MKFQAMPAEDLVREVHIHITCLSCGRQTEVHSSNAIGMNFRCMKCGSQGVHREVIK
jgi:predicted RNA-binding Zn-ribbon protein involved in translation (DUF1610 family)